MNVITDAFINALLADATYALEVNNIDGFTGGDLKPLLSERMTESLAQYISDNFMVVTNINTSDSILSASSGFDATVWMHKTSGKIYVSTRGTDFIYQDLVNDADLTLGNGAPARQIVDMVNWWLRITTPEQLYVKQIAMFDAPLSPADYFYETTPVKGKGLVSASSLVTVNGHSLGGALATTFANLINGSSTSINEVNTFNSAGFTPVSWLLFSQIKSLLGFHGGVGGYTNNNYFASNGISLTTREFMNSHFGLRTPLSQENGNVDPFSNHYMYKITDLLALGNLLSTLDPSIDFSLLNKIVDSGSNKSDASLEWALDGFRKLLGLYSVPTPIGDIDKNPVSREQYHVYINELNSALTDGSLAALVNKVLIVVQDEHTKSGKTDYGQFLALYFLTPFALQGSEDLLSGLNSDLFSLWSADKSLTVAERANGKANFSDAWYEDRTAMLIAQNARNATDALHDTTTNTGSQDIYFYDSNNDGPTLVSKSQAAGNQGIQVISFGNDAANNLFGLSHNDHLYGGAGNDKLGSGAGNDVLDGGAGIDELTGGEGHDVLLGGEGADKYIFEGDFGTDIIKDSDGNGSINIAGWSGGFTSVQGSDIIFRDASKKFEAIKINNGSSTDLLITSLNDETTGNILIKNWNSGNLGISLTVDTTAVPNTSAGTVNGDGGNNAITLDNLRDNNPTLDLSTFSALYANGGSGNDIIMGMLNGNDTLLGGAGDDIISGGFTTTLGVDATKTFKSVAAVPGADSIDGGAGKDFIFASAGGSIAHGGSDNDILLSTGPAYFQFNNLKEVLADESRGITGHRAITRDEIYADAISRMNFGVEKNGLNYKLNNSYFKDFTSSYAEYNSAIENVKFIGKKGSTASNHSNGDVSYGFTGSYTLTYDYSNNGVLAPLSTDNPSPASLAVSMFTPGAGKTLDDFANVKGANLFGDAGDDYLGGGIYADYLSGGADNDVVFAGAGNDIVDGGDGNDELHGEEGRDIIIGGKGDDTLVGGTGNDLLVGGEGSDGFIGDEGDDTLVGGVGDKFFSGGAGNNIYIFEDIVYDDADVQAATNNQNPNALGYASLASQTSTQTTTSSAPLLTIDSTEGNNTLALVGVSSLDQISLTAQDNSLILRTGNAAIFIRDGLSGAVDHLALGDSADEFKNSATSAKSTSIDDVMLARLSTEVTRTAQTAGTQLAGGLLNDTLTAHAGGSILIGGQSDDTLRGNVGDDVYVIRAGDGFDSITEQGGNNTIKLTEGITADQLALRRTNGNLLLMISNGQSVVVNGMFNSDTGDLVASKAIHRIEFSNGEFWDLTRLLQESVKGLTITGSNYNDWLIGYESSDTLIGGKGNDKLRGDKGDDHYHFDIGDGADQIDDNNGNDHVHFGEGIAESQVSLRKDTHNNLIIRINNSDSITVLNAFNTAGELTAQAIEQIHFNNTSVWDLSRIQTELARNQSHTFTGTAGNDHLVGDNANQILNGGQGNDQLNGGNASDVYQYALGDGNDVIKDISGNDRLELLAGINESEVVTRRSGNDLVLTMKDGGSITIQNTFGGVKAANVVDPVIATLIEQLQSRWMSQAEKLIEEHYGLTGSGDITLGFEAGMEGAEAAHVEDGAVLKLVIDLSDFSTPPNGTFPFYYDRIIAHEMVHAVMMRNMDLSELPGWFTEGTAEFIHGADERVKGDTNIISLESNFNLLFKTTAGSPSTSAGYSVSYIAVKLLDKEIRSKGGLGIREVFDQLKTGKTLDQSLIAVSAAHSGLATVWNNLSSFEAHFKAVGFSQYTQLLKLDNIDTGSIAGSDYGHGSLNASAIMPETLTGPSKDFNLIIPEQYTSTPEMNGALESIVFSSAGTQWDQARINQEALKPTNGDDIIHAFDTNNNLSGAKGNDQLFGYAGNDVYRYATGDGSDVIIDSAGTDQIELSADILTTDISLNRDLENNLIITLKDSSTLTVKSAFDASGNLSSGAIESIKFLSGVEWNSTDINREVLKYEALKSTDGDDVIHAFDSNDTLSGAKGNDQLFGYAGDDVYRYKTGDGSDVIIDSAGTDQIELSADILAADIKLRHDLENNLVITLKDGSTLTVKSAFDASGNLSAGAIESIHFLSGGVWNDAKIKEEANKIDASVINGTAFNDTIPGTNANDILVGAHGDDELLGGSGDDRYVYNLGDGNDQITDAAGIDEITFGDGVVPTEVLLYRQGWYGLKVVLKDGGTILINNMFNSSLEGGLGANPIEGMRFANNEFWDITQIKNKIVQSVSTSGNDYIEGFSSSDVMEGGRGYDRLDGKAGDDRYIFNRGDGVDVISDSAGSDTIVFGQGIAPDDVLVYQNNGNIYFIVNNGEMVQVNGMLIDGTPDETKLVERVEFSGGIIWDKAIIQQKIIETQTNPNILFGRDDWDHLSPIGSGNFLVNGLADDDQIYGGAGNDTLVGGGGLNFLDGKGGDDTYLITDQPSTNFIDNFRGDLDRILYAEGITPEDVKVRLVPGRQERYLEQGVLWVYSFSQSNDWNLELTTGNTTIYVDSLFTSGAARGAEIINPHITSGTVEFFDGTRWTIDDLLMHALKGYELNDFIQGSFNNELIEGLRGDDSIFGLSGGDTIYGNHGDDSLNGGGGNDFLDGGEGNDTLIGEYDADTLIGGKGNDVLYGDNASGNNSNSDDVYRFNIGDGNDTIIEFVGRDIIEFGEGIDKEHVILSTVENDIVVSFTNSTDSITIINGALPETHFYIGNKIEIFKFSNGDIWNFDPKLVPVLREGNANDDVLTGGEGDDTLIGNGGYDQLNGDFGNDEYRYNLGDGFDWIRETDGNDKIVFGPSITPDMVQIKKSHYEFQIYVNGEKAIAFGLGPWAYGNTLEVQSGSLVETLEFSNGDVWDLPMMIAKSLAYTSGDDVLFGTTGDDLIQGGGGNDSLEAGSGNDTLIGGKGNDFLRGSLGDDVYFFDVGDGSDYINEYYDYGVDGGGGNDSIVFGVGILPADVTIQRTETDLTLKIKNANPITIANLFGTESERNVISGQVIESIVFHNGDRWTIEDMLGKVSLTGSSSANTIYGFEYSDRIDAKEGSDTIYAGGGSDTLIGGLGNDNLYGEAGDDLLQGGDGDDYLTDYWGNNIFEGGKGTDRIFLHQGGLEHGLGTATIRYSLGDGTDYIFGPPKNNVRVELGAGITLDMILLQSQGVYTGGSAYQNKDGFDIRIKGTSDQIIGLVDNKNVEIVFSNGDVLKGDELTSYVNRSIAQLSSNRQSITGKTEPGLKLQISYLNIDNSITYFPELNADSEGNFSFSFGFGVKDYSRISVLGRDENNISFSLAVMPPAQVSIAPNSPTAELDESGFVITGIAAPGAYIDASIPDRYLGGVYADVLTGAYTIVSTMRVANGQSISVVANSGYSLNSPPTIIIAPDYISPIVASGDFDNLGWRIVGNAEKGATVLITDLSNKLLGSTVVDTGTGNYTVLFSEPINNGELVKIVVRDAGGNTASSLVKAPDLTAPATIHASIDKAGQIIRGYTEPGASIIVRNKQGNWIGSATASSIDGAFELTLHNPLSANQIVDLRVSDASGNTSATISLTAGTGAIPQQPSVVIDNQGKIISGVASEAGVVIIRNKDNVEIARAIVTNGLNFSVTLAESYTNQEILCAILLDNNGNESAPSYVIAPDKTAPLIPVATVQTTYPYGITGFAEPSSTVQIIDQNGNVLGTKVASSTNGSFFIGLNSSSINASHLFVTSTDSSGNTSPALDVEMTGKKALKTPEASFDSQGLIVSGTAEPGALVYVSLGGIERALASTVVNPDGSYSIQLPEAIIDGSVVQIISRDASNNIQYASAVSPDYTRPLPASAQFDAAGKTISGSAAWSERGRVQVIVMDSTNTTILGSSLLGENTSSYSISLVTALKNNEVVNVFLKDIAGNISYATTINAPDKTAPTAPTASVDTTRKIVFGNAEAGSLVVVKSTSGALLGSVTANQTTGDYSISLGAALAVNQVVNVTARDVAGNVSLVKAATAVGTIDTTPPTPPSAAIDFQGKIVTGDAEPGSTVVIKNANNTSILGTVTAHATTGTYLITLVTALINKETINVTATDAAGNVSAIKTIIAPDKTAPTPPVATLDATRKIISGTAEAGSIVVVKSANNTSTLGTVTAHATTGAYSITLTTALIDKEIVNVTATDAAGNVSAVLVIEAPSVAVPNPNAITIQAENYTSMYGVQKESTADVGGGQNVGYIDPGDWMAYNNVAFNVPTEGRYKVTYRVSSLNGGARLTLRELSNDGVLGSVDIPTTGAWSNWIDVTQEITLSGGVHNFKIAVDSGKFNINWFRFEPLAPIAPDTTPPALPSAAIDPEGKVITGEAEPGSIVVIKNANNTSTLGTVTANATTGAYSITLTTALINKETINVTATDAAGNASAIKTIAAPDKTAPIPPVATLDATRKIISGTAEAGSIVVIKNANNTNTLGTVTAHATTGAYSISLTTALINKEIVNVTATDASGNVSAVFVIEAPDVAIPNPTAIVIQAENYTSMSGVQKESTTDVGGGQNAGYIDTGDWMAYNNVAFSVPIEGRYKVTFRVASLNGGGRLTLRELSNDSALGSVDIPKTGTWQSWIDVSQEIALSGGVHNFKLAVESGGFNLNWFKLEPLTPIAPDTTPPALPSAAINPEGKVITGEAEPGSIVVVKNANNTSTLGTVTANATTGTYSITLVAALINKETINVTATDAAGNVSAIKVIAAPDKTAPIAPTADLDAVAKIVSGVAEPGSNVTVKDSVGQTLGVIQANVTTGAYSVSFTQALTNGQSIFTTATDDAGNISAATATPIVINTDPAPIGNGLRARYYGYHQPLNGNVDLTNIAQVRTLISNKTPDASFIATDFQYGVLNALELGMGTILQTFLKEDAASLSVDPSNTSDAILKFDGKIQLNAGSYNFRVRADDGYSILVNGAVVAEYNANQAATTRTHGAFTIAQSGLQDIEIVYWDAGGGAFLNVELANTVTGNYAYLNESILFQPTPIEPAAVTSTTHLLGAGYEGVHYYNRNDALIQAMATFAPESGVDTRYRATHVEQGPLVISVGS